MNETSNQFQSAWEGIEKCWDNKQLAHAYLLQGAAHGAALHFAEKLLNLIFDHHPQIQLRTHPDLIWIEPQSKSRRITIDEIRALILRLSQTSFSGGWKAGVIICADRMTAEAANSFLKTLEEPPDKTLLIMVTDEPQSLLPTITSRCQRIVLTDDSNVISNHWKEPLLDILKTFPPGSYPKANLAAAQLANILKELYKFFAEEEVGSIPEELSAKESKALLEARATARMIEARCEILRMMLLWQRDVLFLVLKQDASTLHFADETEALLRQATVCSRADALYRLTAVDEMARQLDRNLPGELVFGNFTAQLI